jgi:hypothetical protein
MMVLLWGCPLTCPGARPPRMGTAGRGSHPGDPRPDDGAGPGSRLARQLRGLERAASVQSRPRGDSAGVLPRHARAASDRRCAPESEHLHRVSDDLILLDVDRVRHRARSQTCPGRPSGRSLKAPWHQTFSGCVAAQRRGGDRRCRSPASSEAKLGVHADATVPGHNDRVQVDLGDVGSLKREESDAQHQVHDGLPVQGNTAAEPGDQRPGPQ